MGMTLDWLAMTIEFSWMGMTPDWLIIQFTSITIYLIDWSKTPSLQDCIGYIESRTKNKAIYDRLIWWDGYI